MAGSAPPPREPTGARAQTTRFAIVAARFNEGIVTRLVEGARHAFVAAKVPDEAVELHWVPGSFELPLAALRLAETGRYAGIVCVGVVIRGETPHFEHVAREAAAGIRHVALTTGVPATFGVITTYTEEQAWARAGGPVGNRGEEAAAAALEMADFIQGIPPRRAPSHRGSPRGSRRLTSAGGMGGPSGATHPGYSRGSP
jgi:6,7-dimethyl-8-ribityllumazine synthase